MQPFNFEHVKHEFFIYSMSVWVLPPVLPTFQLRISEIHNSLYFKLDSSHIILQKDNHPGRGKIMTPLIIFFLLLLTPFGAFTTQLEPPKFIDFKQIEFYPNRLISLRLSRQMGVSAFNHAPEIGTFLADLKDKYNIRIAVETGTLAGYTTAYLGRMFDMVYTIEIQKEFFLDARSKLKRLPNITCHLGNSPDVLSRILPDLSDEPILFYLDAHDGSMYWPLLDELTEISKTHKDNCIVVIDDFKVPGRPDIPYDRWLDQDLCLEYIENHLDKIFTNYTLYYLIPSDVKSRAKLVVIPQLDFVAF